MLKLTIYYLVILCYIGAGVAKIKKQREVPKKEEVPYLTESVKSVLMGKTGEFDLTLF